jgi:hypothetical protein
MDRRQREDARAKKNYNKKKEEAARTKALDEFLKRKVPALLAKFEEEYRKGRADESVIRTNPPAIPNVNIPNDTQWLEDDAQWMDDLPDLGPYLPELARLFLETKKKNPALFRATTFTKDYNETQFIHVNILLFFYT